MSNTSHRGKHVPGLGQPIGDFRVTDLVEEGHYQASQQGYKLLEDPYQTARQHRSTIENYKFYFGTIVYSMPHLHYYRVQLGQHGTVVPGTFLSDSSFLPLGVRSTATLPPNTNVIAAMPENGLFCYIINVVPERISDGKVCTPDWVQQGAGTGYKREQAYLSTFSLLRQGGVIDWSCGRPIDSSSFDWGRFAETGVGVHVDSFQTYLRVNEACGIFFNYFDSYCRLAGIQFDLQTFCEHITQRMDEGENLHERGNIIYPWESVGALSAGTKTTQEFDDKAIQYDIPKGKIDLPDGKEDAQSFYRGREYQGYLGQGYQRFIAVPEQLSGVRTYKDKSKDHGVFQEHIALDGAYTLRSAKNLFIGKRVLIPIPKRIAIPEDQQDGDDSKLGNYKFSSQSGGGEDHKIGDVKAEGEEPHMLRVAGVLDLLAYHYNWKGLHPFHYHKGDYFLPQESELSTFDAAMDNLNFGELASKDFMEAPSPKTLNIDHRYSAVNYYQRESYIAWLDDGGVVIGDGYGSQIEMSGGTINITAPGDIRLLAGKRVVNMGWDCITRASNSVDISANEKDVSIKAEKNMRLLAGNGKEGGILLHSKAEGKTHVYKDKYGEDIVSSGVVLLAKKSQVAGLAAEIYLRTGGGDIEEGPIVLDASKGNKPISLYSDETNIFNNKEVNIWHAPKDEEANPVKSHRFGKDFSKIDGKLIIEKDTTITDGFLLVAEDILGNKNIIAKENLVHKPAPTVGFHDGEISFDAPIEEAKEKREEHVQLVTQYFEIRIKEPFYSDEKKIGNNTLIESLGFSYRDPPGGGVQYRTEEFKMLEPRWQQMARTGMGSGGKEWTEKPVNYQGQDLYPWPGKQKWKDEPAMLQYEQHEIFDQDKRMSKDRSGPYEEAKLASFKKEKLDGKYKTIL